ncbi:MAG: Rsd/AlgQ family anti-sigma factor [Gammaproteobacteria bacterium]|jgi:regulator of sigma D|nr:Rsd/AlgQ family anti-sigma factor [Gammaproteobacteria bacterium]
MNGPIHQPQFDRRSRTQKEIKRLIAERNNVLSQYYNLANRLDYHDSDNNDLLQEVLQEFCQDMIDYIATGHFEIYSRIEDGSERRHEIIDLGEQIFYKIINTTQVAIKFNDLYDSANAYNKNILKDFSRQLSELGENLATRIELEDRFINTLLSPKSMQMDINY